MKKKIEDCFWKQCVVFVGLMLLLFGAYCLSTKYIITHRNLECLTKDNYSLIFQVDAVQKEDNSLVFDAWAFKLETEAREGTVELWLYDLKDEKIIYPKTMEFKERADVNEYFRCEYDYSDCGIVASFNEKKLDLANKDYEVLMSDIEGKKVYQTGTYISNGELMYCLPEEYTPLDVVGTDIEKIVNNGILRVYCSDFGMYVYQYEGELYWIVDKTSGLVTQEPTYIDCMIQTTQPNLLPENRKSYESDNLDFFFQDKELTDINVSSYRVAKVTIPSEYSITDILTGYRKNGDWVWKDNFRIFYELRNEEKERARQK